MENKPQKVELAAIFAGSADAFLYSHKLCEVQKKHTILSLVVERQNLADTCKAAATAITYSNRITPVEIVIAPNVSLLKKKNGLISYPETFLL
jgi:hypothetical protein